MSSSSFATEALKRIEEDLSRLGLHDTLEVLKQESQPLRTRSRWETPETVSASRPAVQTASSEFRLTPPLAVEEPVFSETLPHATNDNPNAKAAVTRMPRFVVIHVSDQIEFKMTELSHGTERVNSEEYPMTPVCFSARSSTSKTSASDPPTNTPGRSPFTWDTAEMKSTEAEPLFSPTPALPTPQPLKCTAPEGPDLTGSDCFLDSPIKMDRTGSFSRVDSLNDNQDLPDDPAHTPPASDPADDGEDAATVVSLPGSEPSPFAADFVFSHHEPPQDPTPSIDAKAFSFPRTPQGSDSGSGGGLEFLKSFNSIKSADLPSCGTSSGKTVKTPFGLDVSTAGSLSSRLDINTSSGEMNSPNNQEGLPPVPLLFNPLGTEKRVSLSLNACGFDWENILNDIRSSKAHSNMPLDSFPEELWMNKESSSSSRKSTTDLLPRYHFSQGYIDQTYDIIDLKIFHKRGKTGFESHKDLYVEMGDIIAGRYQVIKVVGSAVFSKAIKAVDLKLNTTVCLKMVKNVKDYFDQSLDEIKLLRYLNRADPADEHGIVRLLDFFYYREHLFLVFELLRQNLYEVQRKSIKECGSVTSSGYYFTATRMKSVTRQILVALCFLHSKNIIHSDLKPENVLIKNMEACTVKVIDLGSSCFVTDFLGSYVQSRSYRAPEVILGVDYDHKIDIWSLGCLLVELYTGSVLFQGSTLTELIAKIESVCGAMPPWMVYQGKLSSKYYTTTLKIFRKHATRQEYEILSPIPCGIAEILWGGDEKFVGFVVSLLTLDPNKRPSALELLQHPWLTHAL